MPSDAAQTRPPAAPPPTGRPAALTREQVLVAALEIIDQDGVEALTMRRLGQALDRNPIGPVRQYVRLFRSLVLFAEQEL